MVNYINNINKVVQYLLSTLSKEELYKVIVYEAIKITHGEGGSLFLLNNAELERVYTSSPLLHNITPRENGGVYSTLSKKYPYVKPTANVEN